MDEAKKLAFALRNCDVVLRPRGFVKLSDILTVRYAADIIERLSAELENAKKENAFEKNMFIITMHLAAEWKLRAESAEKALRELGCSSCEHNGNEHPCNTCCSAGFYYKWKGPEVDDGGKE